MSAENISYEEQLAIRDTLLKLGCLTPKEHKMLGAEKALKTFHTEEGGRKPVKKSKNPKLYFGFLERELADLIACVIAGKKYKVKI